MIDMHGVLKKYPNGAFATKDGESIKLRAFHYLFGDGNKVYFCTDSKTSVYEHIKKDSNVAFCSNSNDYSELISITGKAVFVDDQNLKKRAIDEYSMLKQMYKTPDNDSFELFYVDVKEIEYLHNGEIKKESR